MVCGRECAGRQRDLRDGVAWLECREENVCEFQTAELDLVTVVD